MTARLLPTPARRALAWLVMIVALGSACAPAPATPTPAATATLAATAMPTSPPPTPTTPLSGTVEDPVAEETVLLARADLARRLQVDAEDITLVELVAVTWPDTSYGCPQEGETYETVDVPGYRLLFEVGDAVHIYHATFASAFYCDAQDEVLPE